MSSKTARWHLTRWTAPLALVATALLETGPAGAAETITTVTIVPVDLSVFVPCSGDTVELTGNVHLVFHVTFDDAGGFHVITEGNAQDVRGVGFPSGRTYHLVSTGINEFSSSANGASEGTLVSIFEAIGQGPGNNFVEQTTFHITTNANGEVTAEVFEAHAYCR
ncbi:MAG: hypothetical protein QM820_57150 [Minicystis sp.]